jgi:hypothetical protein
MTVAKHPVQICLSSDTVKKNWTVTVIAQPDCGRREVMNIVHAMLVLGGDSIRQIKQTSASTHIFVGHPSGIMWFLHQVLSKTGFPAVVDEEIKPLGITKISYGPVDPEAINFWPPMPWSKDWEKDAA